MTLSKYRTIARNLVLKDSVYLSNCLNESIDVGSSVTIPCRQ